MSAYVVDKKLIDAILTFGLSHQEYGPISWHWPKAHHPASYEAGQPWGPAATIIAQETRAELTTESVNRVGQTLWDENVRSVNHRYKEQEETEALTRMSADTLRRESLRLSGRSIDSVLREMREQGFLGYTVLVLDGELVVTGIPESTPAYLRSA